MPIVPASRTTEDKPVLADGEEILDVEADVEMYLGEDLTGKGLVYVTSKNIVWLSTSGDDRGFTINMPFILMHALCKDTQSAPFTKPCVYCHLDAPGDEVSELRFVPSEEKSLERLYESFNKAAELNPEQGGDDGEGDFFFNQSEVYGHLPTVNDDDDDENNADDDAGDSDEKSAEAADVDVAGGMNKLAVE